MPVLLRHIGKGDIWTAIENTEFFFHSIQFSVSRRRKTEDFIGSSRCCFSNGALLSICHGFCLLQLTQWDSAVDLLSFVNEWHIFPMTSHIVLSEMRLAIAQNFFPENAEFS
jgi:hypothetical protein